MFSNAICNVLDPDKRRKIGSLTENELKAIETLIANPVKFPKWLLNRRKDYDTGEDIHLTSSRLKLRKEFDIKRMRKIKSYKGVRHAVGLPVRGQRTKSNFRKNKKPSVSAGKKK